ncbi:MAG: hypothetical protein HZA53_06580 [Planctomycetes bacterium]|nr:hypothetical protein [Planctomycetota bacterium]
MGASRAQAGSGGGARAFALSNLLALLLPGVASIAGFIVWRDDARLDWLDPRSGAGHFAAIAIAGTIATAAGIADWRLHRGGARVVGLRERRVELLALAGGGTPLFAVMAAATLSARPEPWLVPAIALALATTAAIAYDEFTFHRRCSAFETACHRALTLGMGVAWLAWMHGVFVERAHG